MPVVRPSVWFAAVAGLVLAPGSGLRAAPRDEVLRLAPPDAALVFLAQNARDHLATLAESPFAQWAPTTRLGKQLVATANLPQLKASGGAIFGQLGVTPEEVLADVLGDAAAFAYTPGPPGSPKDERAVALIRPRKPETLAKLVERLNDLQTKSGEVKAVVRREHNGQEYYERQKTTEPSEFYCFRGTVFAFGSSEADIRAVIDRDRTAPPPGGKPAGHGDALRRLEVADAALVLLVNPRPLDAELRAKVASAKPDEKPFLEQFEKVWAALDAAAVFVAVGADLEAGVAVRFRPGDLPPALKGWVAGERVPSRLWAAIPDGALLAVAGRTRASELLDTVGSLVPGHGKGSVRDGVGEILGPVFGKDKLALVLDAIGPDWAVWIEPPPERAGPLPVLVAAVEVRPAGPNGDDAARSLLQAIDFGFQMARFAYNSAHTDQIDLKETRDGDVVVKSLVNDKAFPPGFRPSFALKGGFLLVSSSPDGVTRFRPPSGDPKPGGEATIARFSAIATRAYLQTHGEGLAKVLAGLGAGEEKELHGQFDQFGAVLELLDRVEVLTRGDESGMRLAVRVKFAKPLKK
jgi:hypothetical protein